MRLAFFYVVILMVFGQGVFAQKFSYNPEGMVGHRSYFYTHTFNYQISDKVKLQNLILFDTEYDNDKHNILFMRNTLAYQFSKHFTLNTSIGIKNPGKFASMLLQYQVSGKEVLFSYAVGTTYQAGFTLEQSLLFEYTPQLTDKVKGLFRVSAVGNVNAEEYTRGFQHIRLGVKYEEYSFGIAANLEQFNNSWKHLENIGVFAKVNL